MWAAMSETALCLKCKQAFVKELCVEMRTGWGSSESATGEIMCLRCFQVCCFTILPHSAPPLCFVNGTLHFWLYGEELLTSREMQEGAAEWNKLPGHQMKPSTIWAFATNWL